MKFWIDGFRHDTHPSKEISVWEGIAAAVSEYLSMTTLKQGQATDVFNVVLGLSCGNPRANLAEELSALPPDAFDVLSRLCTYRLPVYDVRNRSQTFSMPLTK